MIIYKKVLDNRAKIGAPSIYIQNALALGKISEQLIFQSNSFKIVAIF